VQLIPFLEKKKKKKKKKKTMKPTTSKSEIKITGFNKQNNNEESNKIHSTQKQIKSIQIKSKANQIITSIKSKSIQITSNHLTHNKQTTKSSHSQNNQQPIKSKAKQIKSNQIKSKAKQSK
jgi:hypothetical protein